MKCILKTCRAKKPLKFLILPIAGIIHRDKHPIIRVLELFGYRFHIPALLQLLIYDHFPDIVRILLPALISRVRSAVTHRIMFLYVCSEILCVFLISQIIQVSHIVRIVHLIIHTNLIHKFITVQKQITVFSCDLPNPVEQPFTLLIDQEIRCDRHKHRYILLPGQIQDLPVILLRLSVKRAYLIHLLHIGPHFRNRIKITSKPLPVIIVTISLVFQEILPAEFPVSGVVLRIFQKILCPLTLRCADLNRLNLILRPLQPKIVLYDPAALLIIRIIEQHITF